MDVVIVHHHAADAVRDAVEALREDAHRSALPLHVIVADNGSTPDERALLHSLPVAHLDVGRNAGYAGAINAAFPHTRSDCVVVMNEDVQVLPGCLGALREALQSGAAAAGPELYWDRDCTLLLPCTEERTRRNELLRTRATRSLAALERARAAWRSHARRHWRSGEPVATASLSGAMIAFRRDTWEAVGPFDDAFRLYYEENDWLLRVAAAGLRSLYVPAAKAIHLHSPTSGQSAERRQWEAESFVRFGNRHYGERFMRRLLLVGGRERVVPPWPAAELPPDAGPFWLEVSPSPLGFPAATMRPAGPLPRMQHVTGPLYLQLVDDDGRELWSAEATTPPLSHSRE
jgi:N-acetylglucosaminyl-diphospho-decaprenol L-rhamnosyltransferase